MSEAREKPARVQAAIDFLELCDDMTSCTYWSPVGRELTVRERAAQDAALGVLISYFHGELDYGDRPPNSSALKKRKKKAKAESSTE